MIDIVYELIELHVSSHKCITGHLYKDKYMYIKLCIHQNTFTIHIHNAYIQKHIRTYISYVQTPRYVCVFAYNSSSNSSRCVNIYIYIYMCVCVWGRVCVWGGVCMYVHVLVYICTQSALH